MTQTDTRGAGSSGHQWCALCRAEYVAGVGECAECLVPLVDGPPLGPDDVGDEDGQQLAYDMDDLEAAERFAVDRDLAEHGIVHAWEGATLLVAPYDEDEVDAVLAGADVPERAELDDEEEQVVYDLADWDAAHRAALRDKLDAEGIAHAFDEHGDLIVLATDEDRVDDLVDEVDHPDQLAPESDAPGGLDAVETLGALFVACDRLVHDASDTEGVLAAADAARALATMGPPFGFAPPLWDDLVERSQELRRLLETEAELVDDEAVVDVAGRLRTTLRPYV